MTEDEWRVQKQLLDRIDIMHDQLENYQGTIAMLKYVIEAWKMRVKMLEEKLEQEKTK